MLLPKSKMKKTLTNNYSVKRPKWRQWVRTPLLFGTLKKESKLMRLDSLPVLYLLGTSTLESQQFAVTSCYKWVWSTREPLNSIKSKPKNRAVTLGGSPTSWTMLMTKKQRVKRLKWAEPFSTQNLNKSLFSMLLDIKTMSLTWFKVHLLPIMVVLSFLPVRENMKLDSSRKVKPVSTFNWPEAWVFNNWLSLLTKWTSPVSNGAKIVGTRL